jgi:hypothetical protein
VPLSVEVTLSAVAEGSVPQVHCEWSSRKVAALTFRITIFAIGDVRQAGCRDCRLSDLIMSVRVAECTGAIVGV